MRKIACGLSTFGYNMMPAPSVQAYCYISRLNNREWVHFLIDTGAAETCLNGIYAKDLQPYLRPETIDSSSGIGGSCDYFHERAVIVFWDTRNEPVHHVIWLGIQRLTRDHLRNPGVLHVPCLLVRDIISKGRLDYNPHSEVSLLFP